MKKAGVIGDPVAHSLSPCIHGHWLAVYKIKGDYVPIRVRPRDLKKMLKRLARAGYAGINVTLPHKEAVVRLADVLSPQARRMGAANTLVFRDGLIYADNTDAFGFLAHLRQSLPRLDLRGRTVTVLGAGGAARAVCFALLDAGVTSFHIVNRDHARARRLGRDLLQEGADMVALFDWGQERLSLPDAALLVNATSLGMKGQRALTIDLGPLPASAPVYDVVYRPLMTDLLKQARRRGHAVVTGLGMLLHQARPGFTSWFGKKPRVTAALIAQLEAEL